MAAPTLAGSRVFALDLIIVQGSTNVFRLRYSSGPDSETAAPVDLTGYTAHAQVRRGRYSQEVWLDLEDEIELTNDGHITITIPSSATEGDEWIRRDSGVWDLELTQPDGSIRRFAQGNVTISDEVTR